MKFFRFILVMAALGGSALIMIRSHRESDASEKALSPFRRSSSNVADPAYRSPLDQIRSQSSKKTQIRSKGTKPEETRNREMSDSAAGFSESSAATSSIPVRKYWIRNPIPHASQIPSSSPFPAIWIELPDQLDLTSAQQSQLQRDAETLLDQIQAADESTHPEATKAELINASDLDFRRKYGVRAWLSHHSQARASFMQQHTR